MTAATVAGLLLSLFSILVTLALGVGVWVNNRRSHRAAERKLTVDEQVAEDDREDVISRRRGEELERLYTRVAALEKEMERLKSRAGAAEQQTFEMIRHIVLLEQMVPNPPGPPRRPNWKLPLLTDPPPT